MSDKRPSFGNLNPIRIAVVVAVVLFPAVSLVLATVLLAIAVSLDNAWLVIAGLAVGAFGVVLPFGIVTAFVVQRLQHKTVHKPQAPAPPPKL